MPSRRGCAVGRGSSSRGLVRFQCIRGTSVAKLPNLSVRPLLRESGDVSPLAAHPPVWKRFHSMNIYAGQTPLLFVAVHYVPLECNRLHPKMAMDARRVRASALTRIIKNSYPLLHGGRPLQAGDGNAHGPLLERAMLLRRLGTAFSFQHFLSSFHPI